AFRGDVDDPALVAGAAQVFPHALEPGAAEIAAGGDERDYPVPVVGVCVEDFPGGPAPEVDVEVFEDVLEPAVTGQAERVQRSGNVVGQFVFLLDPASLPVGAFPIGRVAQDHGHRRFG